MSEHRQPQPDGIQAAARSPCHVNESSLRQGNDAAFRAGPSPTLAQCLTLQGLLPGLRQQGQFEKRTRLKGSGGVEPPASLVFELAGTVRFGDTSSTDSIYEPVRAYSPNPE